MDSPFPKHKSVCGGLSSYQQFRECESLYGKADGECCDADYPKNKQGPFQSGRHGLPVEQLSENDKNNAD